MNPLATLKEKLMIKPNITDRERIAVVIKGVKSSNKKELTEKQEEKTGPIIVDETEKGYDIGALKKKLIENKKLTVLI